MSFFMFFIPSVIHFLRINRLFTCREREEVERMKSFLEIYDAYYDEVYRYVRFRVGDVWDTDDLVSDIFRKSLEYVEKQNGHIPGHTRAWLFTIARNRIIDHYRRKKEIAYGQDPETAGYSHITEIFYEVGMEHECLERAMLLLEPPDQEYVHLKYMMELTYEEISQVTGKEDTWLRIRVHRIRKKMAAWIQRCLDGGDRV